MRTLPRIGVLAALLVAVAPSTQAQGILGRIRKKAADAVEKKAEDKAVEKIGEMMQRKIDASFDAIFGDSANPAPGGKAASAPSGSAASSGAAGASSSSRAAHMPFSIGGNAKTEATYAFDVVTTMEIQSTKGNGSSDGTSEVRMYYNSHEPYSGTEIRKADGKEAEGDAFVILDAKNQAMVMLVTDDKNKKGSIAYDWHNAAKYADAAKGTTPPPERVNWDTVPGWHGFTKIGTKTIAGYSADGYRGESDESTAEVWVSRDPKLASGRMFAASSNLKQMRGQLPPDFPDGMVLEVTGVRKSTGEKVVMRVTSIDTNAHASYSMADYPRMIGGKE